ncbi:MAG: lactate racemase domain-containing protein [Deltaproteobacteria bacterium]|nr:lactate racemase domain-containing protein [Deltaproteobacteria bacterium]
MIQIGNKIKVPQRAWSGDIEAVLDFPKGWEVRSYLMKGHDAPPLTHGDFLEAFARPFGSKPIRELARGKKNVVILFDDLSRPTMTQEILPYVLDELAAGGVKQDAVQFICALGSHGALPASDFRKKLGRDVVAHFPVYNHNPYENCKTIGKTKRGTPVSLNREFLDADLKIGIGTIVPHPTTGFGGGPKIVLPGVAAMESINYNHREVIHRARTSGIQDQMGFGLYQNNAPLLDMIEACRMSGLDIKIDALVNTQRRTVALFVGHPIEVYYAGVEFARDHYLCERPHNAEVLVVNANAKVNESFIAFLAAQPLLKEGGGTLVLISNNPYGEVPHYTERRFGNHIAGQRWKPPVLSTNVRKFIFFMPERDLTSLDWFPAFETVYWADTWSQVKDILDTDYPEGCRVAVIPDGTIQYFR